MVDFGRWQARALLSTREVESALPLLEDARKRFRWESFLVGWIGCNMVVLMSRTLLCALIVFKRLRVLQYDTKEVLIPLNVSNRFASVNTPLH